MDLYLLVLIECIALKASLQDVKFQDMKVIVDMKIQPLCLA